MRTGGHVNNGASRLAWILELGRLPSKHHLIVGNGASRLENTELTIPLAVSIGVQQVAVQPSPFGGDGGQGLFATEAIAAGTVVAEMVDQARMRKAAFEIYRMALGMPHDACIHAERSPLVFYDQSWQEKNHVPLWYRQNHAREDLANVKMMIENPGAGPHQQRLVWKAVRVIARGEELRFTYADVPSSWNKA